MAVTTNTHSPNLIINNYASIVAKAIVFQLENISPVYEGKVVVVVKAEGQPIPYYISEILFGDYFDKGTELTFADVAGPTYNPTHLQKYHERQRKKLKDQIIADLISDPKFSNAILKTASKVNILWALGISTGVKVGDVFAFISGKIENIGDYGLQNKNLYSHSPFTTFPIPESIACSNSVGLPIFYLSISNISYLEDGNRHFMLSPDLTVSKSSS